MLALLQMSVVIARRVVLSWQHDRTSDDVRNSCTERLYPGGMHALLKVSVVVAPQVPGALSLTNLIQRPRKLLSLRNILLRRAAQTAAPMAALSHLGKGQP